MDVFLNLVYGNVVGRLKPIGVFRVNAVQELLEYVQHKLSEKYAQIANLSEDPLERYYVDGEPILQKGDIPEPESVEHSIDIFFGRGHDCNTIITEINELFGGCKRYTPIEQ